MIVPSSLCGSWGFKLRSSCYHGKRFTSRVPGSSVTALCNQCLTHILRSPKRAGSCSLASVGTRAYGEASSWSCPASSQRTCLHTNTAELPWMPSKDCPGNQPASRVPLGRTHLLRSRSCGMQAHIRSCLQKTLKQTGNLNFSVKYLDFKNTLQSNLYGK